MDVLFQMSMPMDLTLQRASVTLGFFTLASALATFISCRSCLSFLKYFGLKDPMANKTYKAFYQYHSYYWRAFFSLVAIHVGLAIAHTGIPQAGDPDAPIHWFILSFGFSGVVFLLVIFSSCRIMNKLFLNSFKSGTPLLKNYQWFYKYHSYYWWVFILIIIGHFAFAYHHVGFWPLPEM